VLQFIIGVVVGTAIGMILMAALVASGRKPD
jgi:hypothetical protein